jgi:hypothetical protein
MLAGLFREDIKVQFPEENADDVIIMIEILALERLVATGSRRWRDLYGFAGGIICLILDPVKSARYKNDIAFLRRSYKGIFESRELREKYRRSFSETLLFAESVTAAIERGVTELFTMAE